MWSRNGRTTKRTHNNGYIPRTYERVYIPYHKGAILFSGFTMSVVKPKIGFLGCGQMGEALAKGMIANVCALLVVQHASTPCMPMFDLSNAWSSDNCICCLSDNVQAIGYVFVVNVGMRGGACGRWVVGMLTLWPKTSFVTTTKTQ